MLKLKLVGRVIICLAPTTLLAKPLCELLEGPGARSCTERGFLVSSSQAIPPATKVS
jgi:hypothetical protein